MARRSDLQEQVKALQAQLATAQSGLAAAVMDKANLESELMIEREANAALSEQGVQLRADLAAATAEITRLRAIIDAAPPPSAADLQSQLQQLD